MSWGAFQQRDRDGQFMAYHVVPIVEADGDELPSTAHKLSAYCECHPLCEISQITRTKIFSHHDPEAEGALSETEWDMRVETYGRGQQWRRPIVRVNTNRSTTTAKM